MPLIFADVIKPCTPECAAAHSGLDHLPLVSRHRLDLDTLGQLNFNGDKASSSRFDLDQLPLGTVALTIKFD